MKIRLKKFLQADFETLINWIDSPKFLIQWGGPHFIYPLTREQLENHYAASKTVPPKRLIFKALHSISGKTVGMAELNDIDPCKHSARICRVLVGPPDLRGKGIGTLIMKQIIEEAFGRLNLEQLNLKVYDFNTPAIRCYEKLGFKKKNYIKNAVIVEGDSWHFYEMVLLKKEYKLW